MLILLYKIDLEWQHTEKSTNSKAFDLVDGSPLESLYYACSMHKWNDTASASRYNPQRLLDQHRISLSQYEWVALNERARSQAWRDVEQLFEKKSWHSLKTKTFAINVPLDKAIFQLHRLEAPSPILNHFLSKITDAQHRLALARKIGASKSVVDALVDLKDRQPLQAFVESLPSGTDVRFYADNALKSMKTKWKSSGDNR